MAQPKTSSPGCHSQPQFFRVSLLRVSKSNTQVYFEGPRTLILTGSSMENKLAPFFLFPFIPFCLNQSVVSGALPQSLDLANLEKNRKQGNKSNNSLKFLIGFENQAWSYRGLGLCTPSENEANFCIIYLLFLKNNLQKLFFTHFSKTTAPHQNILGEAFYHNYLQPF